MKNTELNLKWWTTDQNNSGGYFIENDDVSHWVSFQAENAEQAKSKASDIFSEYGEYCDCCGERWYFDFEEDDGTEVPEIYGIPYTETRQEGYREEIVLHYVDGSKETYKFK